MSGYRLLGGVRMGERGDGVLLGDSFYSLYPSLVPWSSRWCVVCRFFAAAQSTIRLGWEMGCISL